MLFSCFLCGNLHLFFYSKKKVKQSWESNSNLHVDNLILTLLNYGATWRFEFDSHDFYTFFLLFKKCKSPPALLFIIKLPLKKLLTQNLTIRIRRYQSTNSFMSSCASDSSEYCAKLSNPFAWDMGINFAVLAGNQSTSPLASCMRCWWSALWANFKRFIWNLDCGMLQVLPESIVVEDFYWIVC